MTWRRLEAFKAGGGPRGGAAQGPCRRRYGIGFDKGAGTCRGGRAAGRPSQGPEGRFGRGGSANTTVHAYAGTDAYENVYNNADASADASASTNVYAYASTDAYDSA